MAMDNEHQNEEHWLKVLAGDVVAEDGDSRQAEPLRQYFTQRAAIEFDAPQDPERTKRMLNQLEARGAFQAIKPSVRQRSQEETTWLGRFRTWLLPPGGGHAARRMCRSAPKRLPGARLAAPGGPVIPGEVPEAVA